MGGAFFGADFFVDDLVVGDFFGGALFVDLFDEVYYRICYPDDREEGEGDDLDCNEDGEFEDNEDDYDVEDYHLEKGADGADVQVVGIGNNLLHLLHQDVLCTVEGSFQRLISDAEKVLKHDQGFLHYAAAVYADRMNTGKHKPRTTDVSKYGLKRVGGIIIRF